MGGLSHCRYFSKKKVRKSGLEKHYAGGFTMFLSKAGMWEYII
jgi:hypothetical protein